MLNKRLEWHWTKKYCWIFGCFSFYFIGFVHVFVWFEGLLLILCCWSSQFDEFYFNFIASLCWITKLLKTYDFLWKFYGILMNLFDSIDKLFLSTINHWKFHCTFSWDFIIKIVFDFRSALNAIDPTKTEKRIMMYSNVECVFVCNGSERK